MTEPKSPKHRILLVEDDDDVVRLVDKHLSDAGYEVICAGDGAEALELVRVQSPGLVILDLMLPEMSGLEVCRQLRNNPAMPGLPIIILSALSQETDRVVGLELGADDYVTKPFSPRELVLRVGTLLRGKATDRPDPGDMITFGEIEIRRSMFEVRIAGMPMPVTATEYKLLLLLIERQGRLQSRENLLREVWGYDSVLDTRTVDSHVRRLRKKMGIAARYIDTVRSFGYRIIAHA